MTNQCACGEHFASEEAYREHVADCDLVQAF